MSNWFWQLSVFSNTPLLICVVYSLAVGIACLVSYISLPFLRFLLLLLAQGLLCATCVANPVTAPVIDSHS